MALPLLGWIAPQDRSADQTRAHEDALSRMPKFAIADHTEPTGPVKLMLTDLWKHPSCIADMGQEFTGFHQLTGSCVGASEGNLVTTLSCVQRLLTDGATKAFIVWWLYAYGRTRFNEGDRGQGEGAVDSVMGDTLVKEGCFSINEADLPKFSTDDGFYLTSRLEMQWSDGARIDPKYLELGKTHPLGTKAVLNSTDDIRKALINGYPVIDGCEMYVGNGSIQGSGDSACVIGHYDGRGGHSTCFLGYWDHPTLGPLFLYSNQWPSQTYPKDPAGAGRCCVWMTEKEVAKLFSQYGGGDGETFAASHLNYFPAQPDLIRFGSLA